MRYLSFVLVALFGAGPAMADICADHWFTRNLIMDRAGYCFGSKLGQSMFDNADCIGKSVALPPAAADKIATIRKLEQQQQCKVDTRSSVLELEDREIRRRLHVLPVRDEFESACIGWREGVTALRAAPDAASPVVGRVTDGDTMLYSHLAIGGWSYVTVYAASSGPLISGGWLGAQTTEKSCRSWAG